MKKLNLEKLLLIFIILLPILDIVSFLFRNNFDTSFSPSTFIRPIISIIVFLVLFFKYQFKIKAIIVGFIYLIYYIIHLYIFNKLKTDISYGTWVLELQYLVNYTFAVLNLFIYIFVFYKKNINKIYNTVLISNGIYLLSLYISIITNTSSTTYLEGIGLKGWFESGNSISSILILNLFIIFICLDKLKNIKLKAVALLEILLCGVFLTSFLGTRTGLYGFVLVAGLFLIIKIFFLIKNANFKIKYLNKILLVLSILLISFTIFFIVLKGSSLLDRRKYLESIENDVYDTSLYGSSHITGDVLELKEEIESNNISENYISKASQKAILSLYDFANKYQLSNTNRRVQQLIYNFYLVKNQFNIFYILFGNGFLINYGELILEMEIPAFLFNFGLFGFILYFLPFFILFIYYFYIGIKNIKFIDEEYLFLLCALFMSFALSFLLGRIFFSSSAMIIIAVINVLLYNKCIKIKAHIMED